MTTDPSDDAVLRRELRSLLDTAAGTATLHQRAVDEAARERVTAAVDRGLGQLGLTTMELPEAAGGADAQVSDVLAALEETGRSLLAPNLLPTAGLALPTLLALGLDDDRLADVTAPVLDGACWTAAWPGVTCDPQAVTLGADGAVTGRIAALPSGDVATQVVLVVPDRDGVTVVLIAIDDTVRRPVEALDLTRGLCELVLDAAPATVLGRLDAPAAEQLRARWLVGFAAEALGGCSEMLDQSVAYASLRTAFGRPIGSFQAVRHRCADMFVRTETLRASVQMAGRAIATGAPDALDEAIATLSHALEAYASVSRDAVLVHGGIGFTYESDVHFHVRRAHTHAAVVGPVDRLHIELVDRYAG